MVESTSSVKILILGLDNSGKTSICLSLQKSTNLLDFYQLKPTKGVSIQKLECNSGDLSLWDFGGQQRYRVEYLENFQKYTGNMSQIIYVIDVQNVKRYDESLNYLKDIINSLNQENVKVEISVYLHKYDPSLPFKKEFKEINEQINQKLLPELKKLIPKAFKSQVFKTSIYTTFEREFVHQEK
ncbi:MAG: ADP-ribosylation factor-like protein [Promethearchaeota archaeon]